MANDMIYQRRLEAVREALAPWGVEGVLIGHSANRRWLSGFTGSAGQLLVTRDKAILATDSRYWEQAADQAPAFTLFRHQRMPGEDAAFIAGAEVSTIGLEATHVTLAQSITLEEIAGITWVPLPTTLERMRKVKSEDEVEQIRAAAAITDEAMAQVNRLAQPGISERALAWELEKRMREKGADAMAFDIIVASGPNSARPHHHPGERLLQAGDPLIVDMGADVGGYKSDLTRSFFVGDEPDERFWSVYNVVLSAHKAVLEGGRPGMTGKEVDALARDFIGGTEYADDFGHGLGHGVGLEIHEGPSLSRRPAAAEEIIAAGMTITIEPGVYLPGWGGARIEDLVLITENGVESISQCPKTPIIPVNP